MQDKYDVGDALRERGLKDNISRFECAGCGRQASIIAPREIADLVEHAMHDHVNREPIMAVRIDYTYAPAWEMAWQLGLEPQTQAEADWRAMKTKADAA